MHQTSTQDMICNTMDYRHVHSANCNAVQAYVVKPRQVLLNLSLSANQHKHLRTQSSLWTLLENCKSSTVTWSVTTSAVRCPCAKTSRQEPQVRTGFSCSEAGADVPLLSWACASTSCTIGSIKTSLTTCIDIGLVTKVSAGRLPINGKGITACRHAIYNSLPVVRTCKCCVAAYVCDCLWKAIRQSRLHAGMQCSLHGSILDMQRKAGSMHIHCDLRCHCSYGQNMTRSAV